MKILIWERRGELGLTLIKLASLSGVSKSEINAIENGRVSPRLNTLERLAKAMDCKISDLYEEE